MNTQDRVNDMVDMLNKFNTGLIGENWASMSKTNEGKTIDWGKCIVTEYGELMDSYPWKHWKAIDTPIDTKNVLIELVDIFHFLISYSLTQGMPAEDIKLTQFKDGELIDDESVTSSSTDRIIRSISTLTSSMITLDANEYDSRVSNEMLLLDFSILLDINRISVKTLHEAFVAKNILNEFRQYNGYKDGTYRKLWDGVNEDNDFLIDIIEKIGVEDKSRIMKICTETYESLRE